MTDLKPKHDELPLEGVSAIMKAYHFGIRMGVKLLALAMALIILLSIIDVIYEIFIAVKHSPHHIPGQSDILKLFGAAMTTLIGIEIFINVRVYLGSEVIPIKLVIATALMAVARKIIVLDLSVVSGMQAFSVGMITLALGVVYFLLSLKYCSPHD